MKRRMMMHICIILLISFVVASPIQADSLWSGLVASQSSYFVDRPYEERHVNDIIFILINEATNANVKNEHDSATETKIDGSVDTWFGLSGWKSIFDLLKGQIPDVKATKDSSSSLPAWELNIKNEFEGDGELVRKNSVQTKIAARIVEIMPNGNMLLEAKRNIRINKEKCTLLLSGYARPDDIDIDNQIQSSKLAELNIAVLGRGEITSASRPGLLTKIVGLLK